MASPSSTARTSQPRLQGPSGSQLVPASAANPSPQGVLSAVTQAVLVELAAGLEDTKVICERYGVGPAELKSWLGHPAVVEMFKEAKRKFASLGNTSERIKIKAQLLIEMNLPVMHDIVNDTRALPAARVSAFAAIRTLTGLERPEPQPAGAVFKLQINIGPDAKPIIIEGDATDTPTLATIDDDGRVEPTGTPPQTPDDFDDGEYAGN